MKFTEEEQEKINKLPVLLKMAFSTLVNALKSVINGDCDESTLANVMTTVSQNSMGRYSTEDLVNYEQAAKILGISTTNRSKLKLTLDLHGIKQVTIHNQRVGFRRDEVLALKNKLYKEKNDKKRNKEKKQLM